MACVWSSDIDAVFLSRGHHLGELGIRNWALKKADALAVLNELSELQVAVLGGDVYVLINSRIESTYDSWYCEMDINEDDADFVERSIQRARAYILSYMSQTGQPLFALVPKIS